MTRKKGRSPPAVAECVPLQATGKQQSKRPPFQKPTISEVDQYVLQIGATVDARQFCDYYESNGWLVGRAAMRDWKATVRNWESRRLEGKHYARSKSPTREHAREQANADSWAVLEAVASRQADDATGGGEVARLT